MATLNLRDLLLPHLRCELDLSLLPGEFLVLTGENGIGKSTLLSHLRRKLPGHTVLCEQKNLEHFFDRSLGRFKSLVEETPGLDENFFQEFWTRGGFDQKADRPVSYLSGGESQLLKLLIHASAPGETYLFDEPGQHLDREKKALALEILQRLRNKKRPILIVEHDLSWLPPSVKVEYLVLQEDTLRRKV